MTLRRESLFLKISNSIEDSIKSGRYGPGSKLPTEAELSAYFCCSRHTVREALAQIRRKGLIESRPGIGTIVCSAKPPAENRMVKLPIFDFDFDDKSSIFCVDRINDVIADTRIAEKLNVAIGQHVTHLVGIRYMRESPDKPVCRTEYFMLLSNFIRNIGALDRGGSIYNILEEAYRLRVERIEQEMSAVDIEAEISDLLDAEIFSPALKIDRVYYSRKDHVLFVSESIFPSNRYQYSISFICNN